MMTHILVALSILLGQGEKKPTGPTERLIVTRPDVQKEVEILGDQVRDIEKIGLRSPLRQEMTEIAMDKSIPFNERMQKVRELDERLRNERAPESRRLARRIVRFLARDNPDPLSNPAGLPGGSFGFSLRDNPDPLSNCFRPRPIAATARCSDATCRTTAW
jgi:hypothetical protein